MTITTDNYELWFYRYGEGELDERERRSTEAYLIRKWLGMDTSNTRATISLGNVTFADGAVPVIASDRDVTVKSLSMPEGGTLGQSGSGSLTVETAVPGVGYSADGGTLTVPPTDPMGGAVYHFDASDAGSIVVDSVTSMEAYVNPIPSGLVLTGIVVSVSVTSLMLALTVRLYRRYHTLDIDEITALARKEES